MIQHAWIIHGQLTFYRTVWSKWQPTYKAILIPGIVTAVAAYTTFVFGVFKRWREEKQEAAKLKKKFKIVTARLEQSDACITGEAHDRPPFSRRAVGKSRGSLDSG